MKKVENGDLDMTEKMNSSRMRRRKAQVDLVDNVGDYQKKNSSRDELDNLSSLTSR